MRPLDTIWRAILDALRGAPADCTRGCLKRSMVLLTVPTVLELSAESFVVLVDLLWVARLGGTAMAAAGWAAAVMILVAACAQGFSMATGAAVARAMGRGDRDRAGKDGTLGLLVAGTLGLVIAVAGISAAPVLARIGPSPEIAAAASSHLTLLLAGSAPLFLLCTSNWILRGSGDAHLALRVLLVAYGTMLVLDPLLIFGWGPFPAMGLVGAAVAKCCGWTLGVIVQLWMLRGGRGLLRWRLQLARGWDLSRDGALAAVKEVSANVSWVALTFLLASMGPAALGAFTLCNRLFGLAEGLSAGIGHAATTLVGQNLGAGQTLRAELAAWRLARWNAYVLGALGLALFLFTETLLRWLAVDFETAVISAEYLRLAGPLLALYAVGTVVSQAFVGAGDPATPAALTCTSHWLMQIPFAFLFATQLDWGPTGVFVAIVASDSLWALSLIGLFARGRWKASPRGPEQVMRDCGT